MKYIQETKAKEEDIESKGFKLCKKCTNYNKKREWRILELEISNKIANEKNKNNDVTKFMKELEQEKERLEVASKNFPNELCKKLKLPTEYTEILEKKME